MNYSHTYIYEPYVRTYVLVHIAASISCSNVFSIEFSILGVISPYNP